MTTTRTRYLRPGEVMELLQIGRTTLWEWTQAGIVVAERAHPRAQHRYPVDQPILAERLAGAR